ncbi:MAG: GNAT family N-acetyltransferase [Oscillospiraceae bacterium]|nr:GNAT family N-acetyltransferase [Oscillospiraceae bacterium]
MNEFELKIFSTENKISNSEFEEFYSLMKAAFPKSERRTKKAFRELCERERRYKIYALFSENTLCAFLTVWEFDGFTFGDHFAVLPTLRGGGIGSKMLAELKKQCTLPFIIEVELPEDEMARRRIGFYERNDLKLCGFDYILPAMQKGCDSLPMRIMAYPTPLTEKEFEPIKKQIYKTVYNV